MGIGNWELVIGNWESKMNLFLLSLYYPLPITHYLTKASQKRRFHFGDGYLLAIDLLIPCTGQS
jgi:hypothetical protein